MNKYTVKVLSDAEFNSLPYKHAKDALGLADRKNGTAYIRKTDIRPIQQFVTEHELSELISRVSPHDEDGIRYKKGKNVVSQFISPLLQVASNIPSPVQGVAKIANAANQVYQPVAQMQETGYKGSSIGKAVTGLAASLPIPVVQPLAAAANLGFTGYEYSKDRAGVGDVIGSGVGAAFQAPNLMKMAGQMGKGAGTPTGTTWGQAGKEGMAPVINPYNPNAKAMLPSGQSVSASTPYTSSVPTGFSNAINMGFDASPKISWGASGGGNTPSESSNLGFSQPKGQTGGIVPQQQTPAISTPSINQGGEVSTATKTPMLEGLLGKDWRRTLLGAALPLGAELFSKKAEPFNPQESELFRQTQDIIKQGPAVQLAPAQQKAITADYDSQLEQARQNLMDRYKGLRPGSDISNDSQFREAMIELESDFAEKKANALASAQLGLGAQQAQMMSELAAFDIYQLSQKAGISAQEAKEFKQMMSSLGYLVADSGNRMYTGGQMQR